MRFLTTTANARTVSVLGFSFLFSYILAFLFEGQVLYGLLHRHATQAPGAMLSAMLAHFVGLFACGFFVKSVAGAKRVMLIGMGVCIAVTMPIFFVQAVFWLPSLCIGGFASGVVVASWGCFLKICTTRHERVKSCADVLIIANVLMIIINAIAVWVSPVVGLVCVVGCVCVGMLLLGRLPVHDEDAGPPGHRATGPPGHRILFLFVAVITVNAGLMYRVINPAFEHLTTLVSWYWAVPYVVSLMVIRNMPIREHRSVFLYVGMAMMAGAFICFMLMDRNAVDYLVVDTLLLGACGIFDLFWWSILGEMLDHTDAPAKVFGMGLSANVFGVLCGVVLGMGVTALHLSSAELAVIALVVAGITLGIVPPLNQKIALLLKSSEYSTAYDHMSDQQQSTALRQIATLEPLTDREQDVLQNILLGKSNKAIATALNITESTVKTHVRSIFLKYAVSSRAALISALLKP